MKALVIRSGSRGNATLLDANGHLFLIDMGITLKLLKEGLSLMDRNMFDIEALFLTHEHSDHTAGIRYLPPCPIYTTKGTYDSENVEEVIPYHEFNVGNLKVTPFSTSHDANNPIGFIFECENEKLVYMTDSGFIPDSTLSLMENADYYIFESNHDVKMLMESGRSMRTIERIASDFGHLSNKDSAMYLSNLIGPKTKEIILAHLSLDCNTEDKALLTHLKQYTKKHIDVANIYIHCASQTEMATLGDLALHRKDA